MKLTNNLNDILKAVGLVMQPDGELLKFENNPHNVGMTPMLALGRYIMKQHNREAA